MRIHKKPLVFIAVLLIVFVSFGQEQKSFEEIKKLMNEQVISWNEGDIPSYMQHYWQSDSMMFVGKKGVTYGWKQTLNNYLKSYPNKEIMGKLVFDHLIFQWINASNVIVIGSWQLERKKENIGGYFSLLWKKINGNWKIVIDHTS